MTHSKRAEKSCSVPFWPSRITFSTLLTPTRERLRASVGDCDWTSIIPVAAVCWVVISWKGRGARAWALSAQSTERRLGPAHAGRRAPRFWIEHLCGINRPVERECRTGEGDRLAI